MILILLTVSYCMVLTIQDDFGCEKNMYNRQSSSCSISHLGKKPHHF